MTGAKWKSLTLATTLAVCVAHAEKGDWTCDSGFKNSFGASYISILRAQANGNYDLYIGYQPGDTIDAKTQEPTLLEKDLKCSFDPANESVVLCTNGLLVGGWSRFKSSFIQSKETSVQEDFSVSNTESAYNKVIYTSGIEAKRELIKTLGGENYAIQYIVNPKYNTTKCGFDK